LSKNPLIILGIDPGSIKTGFGLILLQNKMISHIENGLIAPPKDSDFKDRISFIFTRLLEIIDEFKPDQISLEEIFMSKNADSALKLGHVRGAVMAAATLKNVPLFEYTPTRIKSSVVGNGRASKEQVQQMVKIMLKLKEPAQEDASDALAAAITHSFCVK